MKISIALLSRKQKIEVFKTKAFYHWKLISNIIFKIVNLEKKWIKWNKEDKNSKNSLKSTQE
jgi:hypothetical protein